MLYSPYFPYTFLPILLTGLYFVLEKHMIKRWHVWIWWAGCIIFLVWVGWFVIQEQYLYDFFKGYYHGGRKILRDPEVLYDESCYGYVNFPLFAYLFIPLANFEKELAGVIFFIIGYVLLLPLSYWLIKFTNLKVWHRFLLLGLLALNGPLDYSIWLGNTTHIIMLFILLALVYLKQGKEWISGILLGMAGLIKLPLILPSGYFFIRGKWKVVGGGFLIAGIILLLSLLIVPFFLNNTWVERCILSMAGNPIPAYNNQSLSAFLARIFMPGNFSWDPITPTSAYTVALNFGNLLLYIPALAVLVFGQKSTKRLDLYIFEFCIILTCSLLTSPISWTHYFVLLLIPIVAYFRLDKKPSPQLWMYSLLLISLIFISLPIRLTYALYEQTGEVIFLSIHFFGGLLFYVFLLITWVQIKKANINSNQEVQ